jgi:TonB family protein
MRIGLVSCFMVFILVGCATAPPASTPSAAPTTPAITCVEARCVSDSEATTISPQTVEMYRRAGYRAPVFIPPTNYPAELKGQQISGTLVVSLDIDAAGNVTHVEVVKAEPAGIFDAAAMEYVAAFKFEKHDGPTFGQLQRVTYEMN